MVKKYLNKIRPYFKNINNLKKLWKIQLEIVINFISSKDINEECVMHSKCDNIEIMIKDNPEWSYRRSF